MRFCLSAIKPTWFTIALSGLATILSAFVLNAEVLIPASDSKINYYGRFDFANTAKPVCSWPGATIEASFPGPSIGAEISDGSGYIDVEVDGVVTTTWSPQATTHRTISTGLSTGNHTVRLILRSEFANVAFSGFYIADGKQLNTLVKPARKIEIIGDSWSDGYLILTTSACANWDDKAQTNANLSWGRRLSKAFHAQDMIVAKSGIGMATSLSGDQTMPARYPGAMFGGATNWNFSTWTPDLVIVFLGINDWSSQGKTPSTATQYKDAYHTFIGTIRSHHPNVPILCMGYANWTVTPQTIAAAETNVSYVNCPLANGTGCWAHPTVTEAQTIANGLIPKVKQMMGWDTTISSVTLDPAASADPVNRGVQITSDGNRMVISARTAFQTRQVQILDVNGRLLEQLQFGRSGSFCWNTSAVQPGLYMVGNSDFGWTKIMVGMTR